MRRLRASVLQELSFFFTVPALVWQLFFLFIPLIIVLFYSIIQLPEGTLTLAHYRDLINPVYFQVIFRSLVLAIVSSAACLLLGYPLAYYLALSIKRGKNFLLFLVTLPFWTSFLILIYSWYFLLEQHGIINSMLLRVGLISAPLMLSNNVVAIFVVMLYCYLPFMIMPLYSSLEKIDPNLLEASADLGATPWQTFWRVTVPLSLPGVRTGTLLVLVPTFGEFAIPALIGGSKSLFVGSLISYFYLVARDNSLGSAFTVLSGVALLVVAVVVMYLFSQRRAGKVKGQIHG
jgi:spermidine/putrescine transport system permease protein